VKAFALIALILAAPTRAADSDAPAVIHLEPGEPSPGSGLFLSDANAITQAQRIKRCEAKAAELERSPKAVDVVLWAVGGLIVGAVVGGVVVGVVKK